MSQPRKNSRHQNRSRSRAAEPSGGSGQPPKPYQGAPLISAFIDEGGQVAVQRVAESFGLSKGQLAETVGLSRETFHKTARANAAKTQSRIREVLEIVSRVSAWAAARNRRWLGIARSLSPLLATAQPRRW
jgi:ribosome-binding protein aMBF1 (putative translation factor)